MMPFNITEWLNLIFRWAHVFAAILWVGSTYYFTWLDGQMKKGGDAPVWMVHSGGFYSVSRRKTLGVPAGDVQWFRWEALATFITGFVLLNVVYYHGGLMVDPIEPRVTVVQASIISIATLPLGWIAYDALAAPQLARYLHSHRRVVRYDHGVECLDANPSTAAAHDRGGRERRAV